MKKSILFPMLALGMGLFSCSQEDLNDGAQQAGQPVTVTVKLPDDAIDKVASRYIPEASDEQHQLRCILLVTNSDNSTIRIEKVAKEANGDTFSYTFTPQDAADYKCAFWADFIDANAAVTGEGNDKKYADLYYNTQNLPSVSYATAALIDGSLFNNDDCDAYCGIIPTGGALSVELKRPFAKVSFVDKGTTASTTTEKISISGYGVYGGFNIETNEVVEGESVISATDIDPVKTDNVFFYNYLFVGNKNALPDADKEFSLAVGSTTKTISTENITLTSNTEVNGNFDWESASGSDKITVTVGFNGNWIDPNAPKVGDYYYSDGTYSSTLDDQKTVIGVVFAVPGDGSAIEGDVITNYDGVTFTDSEIHGWVVSITEMSPNLFVGNKNALPDADKEFSLAVGSTTKTISTENITLTSNTEVNGNFDWESASGSDKITVTVGFNGNWIDPNAPKVGDYYYSDGTYSSTLDDQKTVIGVVFAVPGDGSAIEGDVITNYDGVTFTDSEIHGWVVSITEMSPNPRWVNADDTGSTGGAIEGITGIGTDETDIRGYANTKNWIENELTSPKVYVALTRLSSSYATAPVNTSGWYIGAAAQMEALRNVNASVVKGKLEALSASGATTITDTGTGGSAYYWTSTATTINDANQVRLISFNPEVETYFNQNVGDQGRHCRPILTF